MLATSLTAAVLGVDAHLVRVEADTASGFPKFSMVGLADCAVKESEGRIRAALRNCGYGFKWDRRITVNLAPANLRKMGSSYDLATAVGLLATDGAVPQVPLDTVLLVGELALDGGLRPVSGVLPMVLMARREGIPAAVVPAANAGEAAIVSGVRVYGAQTLPEAVDLVTSLDRARPATPPPISQGIPSSPDMSDVRGQPSARRAIEVAAAGGHNLLLVGPPGSGKTMLARRLPGILPPLSTEEALEVTAIHSAWGMPLDGLFTRRPFRHPHHTSSDVALVGGGPVPRPGEVSLAHNGVLFLDELPEFRRHVLEALRQPLEERSVTIARARGLLRLPARFQLVAAMNPCPCGSLGDRSHLCQCTPQRIRSYRGRVSGPLLDRIDLHVEVAPLSYSDIVGPPAESSAPIRLRAERARERQQRRARDSGFPAAVIANGDLDAAQIRAVAQPDAEGARLLRAAVDRMGLTARAHDRVLRVGLTLADLEGTEAVRAHHVAEALQFRRVVE